MKNQLHMRLVFPIILGLFLMLANTQSSMAQSTEKNRVRIKADYVKIMDSVSYIDIVTSSRIDKKNTTVPNIELTIFNETEEEEVSIGKVTTNGNGECRFIIDELNSIKSDSSGIYNLNVSFNGNDKFRKVSKSIGFKNANIVAKLTEKDSLNFISAILTDASKNTAIIEESLSVRVDRLFRSLSIGEEFNYTDENGTIIVAIEDGIPGVDGNLIIEVILEDNDDYGTVKAFINAPLGTPIVDESTFDQRTMWSPRNKTPLFLLIFPNLLILGMWGIIIYLFINLFKISKSKKI